jgi:hypothetical protein
MAGVILPHEAVTAIVQALTARVSCYLGNLSDEERKITEMGSIMLQKMTFRHLPLMGLRHSMELRRAAKGNQSELVAASRALEILSALFSSQPTVVAAGIQSLGENCRVWLGRGMMANVVMDPFVLRLIDPTDASAVRFALWLMWLYSINSVGVAVAKFGKGGKAIQSEEKPVTIHSYEGPRLPTNTQRRALNGMHLLNLYAFQFFPMVLPDLLALSRIDDTAIVGYLEHIADFSAVAIATHPDPDASWKRIVSTIPASKLPAAGWILASTFPHVEPRSLLTPAMDRFIKNPKEFDAVREFSATVTISAMLFCFVGLSNLDTEERMLKFVEAMSIWRLWGAANGVPASKIAESAVEELPSPAEKFAALCLVFLSLWVILENYSGEVPAFRDIVRAEIDALKPVLRSFVGDNYPGFDLRTADPSRLPLALASWLRSEGSDPKEVSEYERAGDVLVSVCDRMFGVPQDAPG